MRNTSERKAAASPEASKNRCSCPAGASRWYGHQEETVTANVENETAEVESISSESKRSSLRSHFLQKETDTRNMNSVVAALTTGIDAAVSHVQQKAQKVQHQQSQPQFQPQAQPQQFQTTDDDEQSLESETDLHRGEQDRLRHCRQQAGKVHRDFERDEEHVDQDFNQQKQLEL